VDVDQLPPHDLDAERAALGCVLQCADECPKEAETFLGKLRPRLFYGTQYKTLHNALARLAMAGHSLDPIAVKALTKGAEDIDWPLMNECMAQVITLHSFPSHVAILAEFADRRDLLSLAAQSTELAHNGFSLARAKQLLGGYADRTNDTTRPLIELVTPSQCREYKPDPKMFLVGADMISAGEFSVLAGWQGLGKSMLGNTLAFAGARPGPQTWMHYEIRRRFRTLVLQSEGSMNRLKMECEKIPKGFDDFVKFSKPCGLQFGRPDFRQELRRIYDAWPYDLLIIDNWLDVIKDDKVADFMEALDNIRESLPKVDIPPAVLILAHLRKQRGGEQWRPRRGRELVSELVGSFALSAKARTVFAIQPGSMETDDTRIVFETCKSNNDQPLPRSAWHRRPGCFEAVPDFDFESWLNPPEQESRKSITEADLASLFENGKRRILRKTAVKELIEKGFSQPTAYRALSLEGPFKERITEHDGFIVWKT
jgi:hypothetical protein